MVELLKSHSVVHKASFEQALDDLCVRFLVNLPVEELGSLPRICFQIEQAHWFYEDFMRSLDPHRLPKHSLQSFSECMFMRCFMLEKWRGNHDQIFAQFMKYKKRVPVRGAIILNQDLTKCLLVQEYRSKAWGFPKGKIDRNESDEQCAIREVLEEVGFDISPYLRPEDYALAVWGEKKMKLFIVSGVPDTTSFATRTRKEIRNIEWHALRKLPGYGKNAAAHSHYFLVAPFMNKVRKYVLAKNGQSDKGGTTEDEDSGNSVVDSLGGYHDVVPVIPDYREQSDSEPGEHVMPGGPPHELDLLNMLRGAASAGSYGQTLQANPALFTAAAAGGAKSSGHTGDATDDDERTSRPAADTGPHARAKPGQHGPLRGETGTSTGTPERTNHRARPVKILQRPADPSEGGSPDVDTEADLLRYLMSRVGVSS